MRFRIWDNNYMWRTSAKLVLGGVILIGSFTNQLFGWFRAIEYLQRNTPRLYSFATNPVFEYTLMVTGLVLCAVGLYEVWQLRGSSRAYRIEVPGMNGFGKKGQYHDELMQAYIRDRNPDPEIVQQIMNNTMSREVAEEVKAWMSPAKLKELGFSGDVKLVDLYIKPPAGVRLSHARNVNVSENYMEIDPGISGIDAEHFSDGSITKNKIIMNSPVKKDEGEGGGSSA